MVRLLRDGFTVGRNGADSHEDTCVCASCTQMPPAAQAQGRRSNPYNNGHRAHNVWQHSQLVRRDRSYTGNIAWCNISSCAYPDTSKPLFLSLTFLVNLVLMSIFFHSVRSFFSYYGINIRRQQASTNKQLFRILKPLRVSFTDTT